MLLTPAEPPGLRWQRPRSPLPALSAPASAGTHKWHTPNASLPSSPRPRHQNSHQTAAAASQNLQNSLCCPLRWVFAQAVPVPEQPAQGCWGHSGSARGRDKGSEATKAIGGLGWNCLWQLRREGSWRWDVPRLGVGMHREGAERRCHPKFSCRAQPGVVAQGMIPDLSEKGKTAKMEVEKGHFGAMGWPGLEY